MIPYRLAPAAYAQLSEIYDFTKQRWGEAQAEDYVGGLFRAFEQIGAGLIAGRALRRAAGLDAVFTTFRQHHVFWRRAGEQVLILAVLHQRMDQVARLVALAGPEDAECASFLPDKNL